MSKIFLGLITQNQKDNIEELTSIHHFLDGIFAVDHYSSDGTFEILKERKGQGDIIQLPFLQNHSWSMNGFLLNPKLRPGNWIILRDSGERINPEFASKIRSFILELEKRNINTVYQYSKCLMFKKFEHQFFQSSPHWGLLNAQPHYLATENCENFQNPKDYCYSIRNDIRPDDHFIDHFLKYYLYDSSNHLLLGREQNQSEFHVHEQVRYKFKEYCERVLNIELSVKALLSYLLENDLTYNLKWFINFESILNNFYCYHILKHPLDDIRKRAAKNEIFLIK